jgi:Carboxypeptidase regulatory-like domain
MQRKSLTVVRESASKVKPHIFAKAILPCLFVASLVLVLVLVLMPGRASAQATGQISGTVTDPSGSVVVQVKVELTSPTTAEARSAMTGPDGSYKFPLVAPGIYQIRVNQTGFRASVTQDVEVLVNGTTRADVRLVVGSASEQVTVTDAAPLVETANATMGSVVEHQSIIDLPLNGRNFAQLGTLIPGVCCRAVRARWRAG